MLFPWLCAVFGLIVGSFLNVVVLRFGTEQGIGGRSHCPVCHKQLSWYELIPVVSFLIQRGRCRSCKTCISPQYIVVELFTAVMFFFAGNYTYSLFWDPLSMWFLVGLLLSFSLFSLIVMIVVHDIKTQLIPTVWIIGLFIIILVLLIVYYASYGGLSLSVFIPHIIGLLISIPFLVLSLFSHGRWIGFADIEIIAWMGMMLGFLSGISAVLIAFYIGAAFAVMFVLYYMIIKKQNYQSVRTKPIPFAPFLFFGWLITLTTSFSLIDLFARLFL